MAVPDTAPRREGTPHAPDAPGTPGPRELIAAAQAGDPEARRRMVEANMRLVHAIVRRFTSRLHGGAAGAAEDLFQVGCLGLLKAVDGFDVSRPVRFSTYAVPVIVGELRRYLREQHPVRVSRGLRDVGMRVAACRQQLSQAWGRSPSVEEVSSALGLSREEVAAAESALQPPESLDRLAEEGRAGCPVPGRRPRAKTRASAGWWKATPCARPWPAWSRGSGSWWPCVTWGTTPRRRWPGPSASPRPTCPAPSGASSRG